MWTDISPSLPLYVLYKGDELHDLREGSFTRPEKERCGKFFLQGRGLGDSGDIYCFD